MAAAGAKIQQHLCTISTGVLMWADRRDGQTAVLPAQTGIFPLILYNTKAPSLLRFPLVALQGHPTGAWLSVAREMWLRSQPGAPRPPTPPQPFPLAAP